ncbi:MAG: hypothetical protein AB7E85_02615 [Pseudobdellovibrionaceae bacterium]
MTKPLLGQLKILNEAVPFADPAREEAAQKQAEEHGFREQAFLTRFGYSAYADDVLTPRGDYAFTKGDLVKVFKTVSKGEVLWEGHVSLNRERDRVKGPTGYQGQAVGGFWVHGVQDDMDSQKWGRMFFNKLPAKLERDGHIIYGALDPFFETGTEGVIWSVQEFGNYGYAGLHCLKDGDKLTVYSVVLDGEVEWEGPVAFEDVMPPLKVDWTDLHQIPTHCDPRQWLRFSYDCRPVAIVPS